MLNKIILLLIIFSFTACTFKRACTIAWGNAAISDTQISDNSKKTLLERSNISSAPIQACR